MFIDVNNLVQMQGEIVTRIEDHVNSKSSSLGTGVCHLLFLSRCSHRRGEREGEPR